MANILKEIERLDPNDHMKMNDKMKELIKSEDICNLALSKVGNISLLHFLILHNYNKWVSLILYRCKKDSRIYAEYSEANLQKKLLANIASQIYKGKRNKTQDFCLHFSEIIKKSSAKELTSNLAYDLAMILMPNGNELIYNAAKKNCNEVIDLLLSKMNNENIKQILTVRMANEEPLILYAIDKKKMDIIRILLKNNRDPDLKIDGENAIEYVIKYEEDPEILDVFLNYNLTIPDEIDGEPFLEYVIKNKKPEILETLLTNGFNPNTGKRSPLYLIFTKHKPKHSEQKLELLLRFGAKVTPELMELGIKYGFLGTLRKYCKDAPQKRSNNS